MNVFNELACETGTELVNASGLTPFPTCVPGSDCNSYSRVLFGRYWPYLSGLCHFARRMTHCDR